MAGPEQWRHVALQEPLVWGTWGVGAERFEVVLQRGETERSACGCGPRAVGQHCVHAVALGLQLALSDGHIADAPVDADDGLDALLARWTNADAEAHAVAGAADGRPPVLTDAAWRTMALADQVQALERLRAHDPALGLHRLQAAWSAGSDAERCRWIAALDVGLSAADARFLDTAWVEATERVRAALWPLSARVPQTAHATRCRNRALAALESVVDPSGRAFALKVHGPAPNNGADRAAADHPRAAVSAPPRASGVLELDIATVPPELWCGRWRCTPAQAVQWAAETPGGFAAIAGWERAAIRFRDANWAAALLQRTPRRGPALAETLRRPDKEAWFVRTLRDELAAPERRAEGAHPAGPWTPSYTNAVLNVAADALRTLGHPKDAPATGHLGDQPTSPVPYYARPRRSGHVLGDRARTRAYAVFAAAMRDGAATANVPDSLRDVCALHPPVAAAVARLRLRAAMFGAA